jgi:hypothetical protein
LDFITKFTYGESMEAVRAPGFHDDILDAVDSFAVSNYLVRTHDWNALYVSNFPSS